MADSAPKRRKYERQKRRRRSISEEPEIMQELRGFTPEPRGLYDSDVAEVGWAPVQIAADAVAKKRKVPEKMDSEDDGFGSVGLDEEIENIIIKGPTFQQSFPKEARTLVGLLDAVLSGDDSATQFMCGNKCSAIGLELIHSFVTHRLENEPQPFSYKVEELPCQSLRINDGFDLVLLKELSVEQILELARCCDYLQVDSLIDAIYKHITIMLSKSTQIQIVEFLQTAKWPTQEKRKASLDNDDLLFDEDTKSSKMEIEHDIAIGNLDDEDKLEIIPNDDFDETDVDAVLRRNGPISGAISILRDNQIKGHKAIYKMPILFWVKIADCSSARKKLFISRTQASLSPDLMHLFQLPKNENGHRIHHTKHCARIDLALIVDYLRHHNGVEPAEIAKPIRSIRMDRICEDLWDATFMDNLNKKVLFSLTKAANTLNIRSLLHLCCAKVATMIKGKSPTEIKEILGDDVEE